MAREEVEILMGLKYGHDLASESGGSRTREAEFGTLVLPGSGFEFSQYLVQMGQ
jgi:hypothetical protein